MANDVTLSQGSGLSLDPLSASSELGTGIIENDAAKSVHISNTQRNAACGVFATVEGIPHDFGFCTLGYSFIIN